MNKIVSDLFINAKMEGEPERVFNMEPYIITV